MIVICACDVTCLSILPRLHLFLLHPFVEHNVTAYFKSMKHNGDTASVCSRKLSVGIAYGNYKFHLNKF